MIRPVGQEWTPRETATRQFAGLVLAPVDPTKLAQLKAELDKVGKQTAALMRGEEPELLVIPFHRMETLHYARFVLLEDGVPQPVLAFATDYDGPEGADACKEAEASRHHLADLVANAHDGLESIFACCLGYRTGKLSAYLTRHRKPAATFYTGSSGRSKPQILWEASLRRRVEEIVDTGEWSGSSPAKIRERVREQLRQDGSSIPRFPPQPELAARGQTILIGAAVAVAAVLLLLPFAGAWKLLGSPWPGFLAMLAALSLLVLRFRYLERTDPQFQPTTSDAADEHLKTAANAENEFLQNQLTHLVPLKPGPLRWLIIRTVFAALQVLAAYSYNKGKLGGIPSIHFARWVLVGDRNVLFFSNFDSSWQSYLGDFIDQASGGLTAVWSNTIGYPRTTWLLRAGSRDASRFLSWTRHYQHPTQVWYSAYPGLSIVNVNDNTEIRRGLADPDGMDAATWLFRLRGVDRLATDRYFGDERARDPALPLDQIQGLVLWGYGHMPEARFLLFRVAERKPDLLSWIGNLDINSASETLLEDAPTKPLLNIAFTHEGLEALGVEKKLRGQFPTAFVHGPADEYRARVNGDLGANAPEHWSWGKRERPVHVALLVYAPDQPTVERVAGQYVTEAQAHGLELLESLEGTTLPGRKEHFGFRDGIAQPTIQGSGRAELAGNTIAAGEFLLGHSDGYGNLTPSPLSSSGFNFGLNGSYLVLRQLEQDVEAFWRYCATRDQPDGAIGVASAMVGRWPSGAPLLRHPTADPNDPRFSDEDNFSYLANDEDNDRYGARCPFGAHVRRSNPRDWQLGATRAESLELSNLHRVMRRGRPYGPPLHEKMDVQEMIRIATSSPNGGDHAERGLNFLCFNANIERQFEFIQQQWCNNPKFAGLGNDPDPLLGSCRPGGDGGSFTVQSDVREGIRTRHTGIPNFVRVRGAGYFFMPSLPAVKLLAAGLLDGSAADKLENTPPDEQLHIDNLITILGNRMRRDYAATRTLRDAHPKMHACVEALFRIEGGLSPELRVGLFAEPETYRCLVRFSNQAGVPSPDYEKDIRGAAIKIRDVPGKKLLDGEEHSTDHDFITISHDAFVTKDVAEFEALIRALFGGKGKMLRFCLTHRRVAWNLLRSLKRHACPLEIQYFSVAPYLLGSHAVKYSLRPSSDMKSPIPSHPGPDYLRESLVRKLTTGGASFDFLVQQRNASTNQPIEDPGVAWSERDSPFTKVATLEIPRQVDGFDTPERREQADNLTFNPWRCLPEHRPLGGISRARRQVYRALSDLRHGRNAV